MNCNESAAGTPVPVLSFADFSTGKDAAARRGDCQWRCLRLRNAISGSGSVHAGGSGTPNASYTKVPNSAGSAPSQCCSKEAEKVSIGEPVADSARSENNTSDREATDELVATAILEAHVETRMAG